MHACMHSDMDTCTTAKLLSNVEQAGNSLVIHVGEQICQFTILVIISMQLCEARLCKSEFFNKALMQTVKL